MIPYSGCVSSAHTFESVVGGSTDALGETVSKPTYCLWSKSGVSVQRILHRYSVIISKYLLYRVQQMVIVVMQSLVS